MNQKYFKGKLIIESSLNEKLEDIISHQIPAI